MITIFKTVMAAVLFVVTFATPAFADWLHTPAGWKAEAVMAECGGLTLAFAVNVNSPRDEPNVIVTAAVGGTPVVQWRELVKQKKVRRIADVRFATDDGGVQTLIFGGRDLGPAWASIGTALALRGAASPITVNDCAGQAASDLGLAESDLAGASSSHMNDERGIGAIRKALKVYRDKVARKLRALARLQQALPLR